MFNFRLVFLRRDIAVGTRLQFIRSAYLVNINLKNGQTKAETCTAQPRFFEHPRDRQNSSKNRGFEKSGVRKIEVELYYECKA